MKGDDNHNNKEKPLSVAASKQLVASNGIFIDANNEGSARRGNEVSMSERTLGITIYTEQRYERDRQETTKKALLTTTTIKSYPDQIVLRRDGILDGSNCHGTRGSKRADPVVSFKTDIRSLLLLAFLAVLSIESALAAIELPLPSPQVQAKPLQNYESTNITLSTTLNHVERLNVDPNVVAGGNGPQQQQQQQLPLPMAEANTVQGRRFSQSSRGHANQDDLSGGSLIRAPANNNHELRDDKNEKINQGKEEIGVGHGHSHGQSSNRRQHHETTTTTRDQFEQEAALYSVGARQQISRAEHNDRQPAAKIDRRKRSNNLSAPIKQACNDCLAIPMVALVGRRQVNGFIIQPAPSNLHGRLSPSETSFGAHPSNPEYEQSHGVRNNDNNPYSDSSSSNNNNDSQMDQVSHQEPRQPSSRSVHQQRHQRHNHHYQQQPTMRSHMIPEGHQHQTGLGAPETSAGAAYAAGYKTHPVVQNYHQTGPYASQQSHPFVPMSDEKCPMRGPLTVCDQINSYPADAILHKLDSMKQALHKSYFNVDSLFSDESAGLSDPFETTTTSRANMMKRTEPPPVVRTQSAVNVSHTPPMAKSSRFNHSLGEPQDQYHHFGPSAARDQGYLEESPVAGVKSSPIKRQMNGAKRGASPDTKKSPLADLPDQSPAHDHHKRARESPSSSASGQGGEEGGENSTTVVTGNEPQWRRHQRDFNRHEHIQTTLGPPLVESPSLAQAEKFLYLVERKGLSGISGTLHNLRPPRPVAQTSTTTRQIMENSRESGTTKIDPAAHADSATVFRESDVQEDFQDDQEHHHNHYDGARGHELRLTPASESSVKSGHHDGGKRQRCRRTVTNLAQQTYEQGERGDGLVVAKGGGAQQPNTKQGLGGGPSKQLSSNIAKANAADAHAPQYGSVNDGYDDGSGGTPAAPPTWKAKQTSAELDNELVMNNQEQRHQQRQLGNASAAKEGAKSIVSLSSSLLSPVGGGQEGSVERIKVLTSKGLSSVVSSASGQPNLLSSMSSSLSSALAAPAPASSSSPSSSSSSHSPFSSSEFANGIRDKSAVPFVSNSMNSRSKLVQSDHEFAAKHRSNQPVALGSSSSRNSRTDELASTNTTIRRALGRSRRQVPIPADPSSGSALDSEELDPERIAGSAEAPAGNDNDDDNSDQPVVPQPICRAKSIYISPRAALNDKKQWKYIVNAPERDPRIKQIIRVDICEAPFEPCSGDVTLPLGFTSQCKQKYAKKKLLALDSQSGLLERMIPAQNIYHHDHHVVKSPTLINFISLRLGREELIANSSLRVMIVWEQLTNSSLPSSSSGTDSSLPPGLKIINVEIPMASLESDVKYGCVCVQAIGFADNLIGARQPW